MSRIILSRARLLQLCGGAFGLALAGLAALPAAAQSAPAAAIAPAAAPAAAARIWFYRDYEPSVSLNLAAVSLNGSLTGYVQPDGSAFYRDVAPGHYHITAATFGTDTNQSKDVDLGPGQEAYVKILASDNWGGTGGNNNSFKRDAFYVSLVAPQVARADLATRRLTGG